MNKKVPPITESVEELKTLLKKSKNATEKDRVQMLYLLKSGTAKNRTEVADLIGKSTKTIGQWLSKYEAGGIDKLLQRRYAPGRQPYMTPAQLETLRAKLNDPNGFSSYVEIHQYVTETFEVAIGYHAIEYLDKAIELKPDYAEVYYCRGIARYKLIQFELAILDFDKAIELKPGYAEAYYYRGRLNFWWSEFDKMIERKPGYAEAYYHQDHLNLWWSEYEREWKNKLSKLTSSISDFDKAIELKPDYAEAYFYRGRAKNKSCQFTSSISDFDKAIELKPDYAEAYFYRGRAKNKSCQFTSSISDFDKAIELKPNNVETAYYREIVNQYVFDDYIALGNAKLRNSAYCDAIKHFDKAIELFPYYYVGYYYRGHAKYALKQYVSAIADYNKSIELSPDCVEIYYYRGHTKFCLSEYEAAIADFSTVIEHDPTHAEAYINRAVAYYYISQLKSANDDYNEGIRLYRRILALADEKTLKLITISRDGGVNLLQKNGVQVERKPPCSEWCGAFACECSGDHPELWVYTAYVPKTWYSSGESNDYTPDPFAAFFEKYTSNEYAISLDLVVPDKEGLVGVFWTGWHEGDLWCFERNIPIAESDPDNSSKPDNSNDIIDDLLF